jgi:hypothetical protein
MTNKQKAEQIMLKHGLDGLETGDHPVYPSIDRPTVWSIILDLFNNQGWTYERIDDWCRVSKSRCRFVLNHKIVR